MAVPHFLLSAAVIIWVVFELAVRPEIIPTLRAELQDVLEVDEHSGKLMLTNASLKNAERLDSFIREVMRTKGDTLSTIRLTMRDVTLGGYTIPKGTFKELVQLIYRLILVQGQLVCPLATLSHKNPAYHGEDAEEFVGDRWMGQGKPAVMVSPSYWPFGLGRFACPGRALAVAGIISLQFRSPCRCAEYLVARDQACRILSNRSGFPVLGGRQVRSRRPFEYHVGATRGTIVASASSSGILKKKVWLPISDSTSAAFAIPYIDGSSVPFLSGLLIVWCKALMLLSRKFSVLMIIVNSYRMIPSMIRLYMLYNFDLIFTACDMLCHIFSREDLRRWL